MPSIIQNQEQILALNAVTDSLHEIRKLDVLLASDAAFTVSDGEGKKAIFVQLDTNGSAKIKSILQAQRSKIVKSTMTLAKKNRIMLDDGDLALLNGKLAKKNTPVEQNDEVIIDDAEAQDSYF